MRSPAMWSCRCVSDVAFHVEHESPARVGLFFASCSQARRQDAVRLCLGVGQRVSVFWSEVGCYVLTGGPPSGDGCGALANASVAKIPASPNHLVDPQLALLLESAHSCHGAGGDMPVGGSRVLAAISERRTCVWQTLASHVVQGRAADVYCPATTTRGHCSDWEPFASACIADSLQKVICRSRLREVGT